MFDLGIKTPKLIIENLEKMPNIEVPLLKDLYNHLATLRFKLFGQTNMNLGELALWCQNNQQLPPDSQLDQPFVVSYQMYSEVDESQELPPDYEKKRRSISLFYFN
jgi:hypothetical protein